MADYPAARCRRYLNIFLAFWELGFDVQSAAGMASLMVRGSSCETGHGFWSCRLALGRHYVIELRGS